MSLLLALLRKKLAEFDAADSDTRLMLTRDQVVDMMRVFVPQNRQRVWFDEPAPVWTALGLAADVARFTDLLTDAERDTPHLVLGDTTRMGLSSSTGCGSTGHRRDRC